MRSASLMVDTPGMVRFMSVVLPTDTVANIVSLIVIVTIVCSSFCFVLQIYILIWAILLPYGDNWC